MRTPAPPAREALAGADATRLRLRIRGAVQGVGFRPFIYWLAEELGLSGWVRNLPDGAVEFAALGDDHALAGLMGDVRRGPDGAWVTGVTESSPGTDEQYHDPFTILR